MYRIVEKCIIAGLIPTQCHDTIHDRIHYITTKQEGYCLVSCSWAQKYVQLTSLVESMRVFSIIFKTQQTLLSMHFSQQFVRKIVVHKD